MTVGQALNLNPDALDIVMNTLDVDRSFILLNKDKELTADECNAICSAVKLREGGTPLAYIINKRGFWRNDFYVTKDVLIPQPDTETLVEEAFNSLKNLPLKEISILDLCAGSGCIGISLANELSDYGKNVSLVLSDISPKAFDVFSRNADNLLNKNVAIKKVGGNLFDELTGLSFDCIVTNPPYIETDVIATLSEEVQAEPHLALDGGKDGLDLIRLIAKQCSSFVNPQGFLFCEIGFNQGLQSKNIFSDTGHKTEVIKDLNGNDRVVKVSF